MSRAKRVIIVLLNYLLHMQILNGEIIHVSSENEEGILSASSLSSVFLGTPSENHNPVESGPPLKNKQEMYLRKCCATGYVLQNYLERGLLCVRLENKTSSSTEFRSFSNVSKLSSYEMNSYGILVKGVVNMTIVFDDLNNLQMKCQQGRNPRVLNNRNGIWFRLTGDGEILIGVDYFLWAAWLPVEKSSYCIDMDDIAISSCYIISSNPSTIQCNNDPILVFCDLEEGRLFEFTVHRYVYGLSSVVTCVPILITLVAFFYLRIHQNPRKWVLISYFLAYALTCATHGTQILLYVNNLDQEPTFSCKLFNHLFVYLASVFGTACMFVSLDIFYCFWRMNSQLGIINPSKAGIIFCLIFTWVGPLILYVAGEFWREYYAFHPPDLAWKKCVSLNFDTVEFLIMIQFIFKFGIYLSTSLLIYKHKRSTSFATPGAQNDFNESTKLYMKLFVTTGMPFTCLALDYCFADADPMAWYWFAIRFPHSFIGLYIFLVFGLSREVRRKWQLRSRSANDLANLKVSQESSGSKRGVEARRLRGRQCQRGIKRSTSTSTSLWSVISDYTGSQRFSQHSRIFTTISTKSSNGCNSITESNKS